MVLTITMNDKMIKQIDAVRKSEARASYIRRAVEEKLQREQVSRHHAAMTKASA